MWYNYSMTIKPIPNFPDYLISDEGIVFSFSKRANQDRPKKPRKLKSYKQKSGHLRLYLQKEGKAYKRYVHRLVLESFIGECPVNQECRHKDGNPSNNKLSNLIWGTKKENFLDRKKHGVLIMGESHPGSKLTEEQVIEIRKLASESNKKIRKIDKGGNYKEISKKFNVSPSAIVGIMRGSTWKHVK